MAQQGRGGHAHAKPESWSLKSHRSTFDIVKEGEPKVYKIAVMPGDGTGPEVTAEAVKVLKTAATKFGFQVDLTEFDFGGERYKRTGETLPDSAVEELRKFDAILLGAIGHPDVAPGILEKGILLKARFALDQYINLRPVRLYPGVECPLKNKGPNEIDYVVVRENTGDAYTGTGGFTMKGTPHEVAVQTAVYSRHQVDRCLRYAFEYARKHGKKARGKGDKNTLALCGKTNVLTYIYDLWERAFHEIGKAEYPDITREYYHVDATCMWMVKNPEWFDVIVTGNLFGDIITDLGAITQGGMGIAAGGNINPEGVSMFEPIGGSAPKYTGKGVINPLAAICSAQMMLATLGQEKAADTIEKAVMYVTANKLKSLAAGKMGYSTSQVGDLVAEKVAG
ncbi:MAG: 3-isopropylmalate dehydrogenase [Phycisphaerae bacterium]|nr:3-isopropylmalate dehydrogenase [Phycisphaerae bacterium]